jgi:hypothetical protein
MVDTGPRTSHSTLSLDEETCYVHMYVCSCASRICFNSHEQHNMRTTNGWMNWLNEAPRAKVVPIYKVIDQPGPRGTFRAKTSLILYLPSELDIPAERSSSGKNSISHLSTWVSDYNFRNSLGFASGINFSYSHRNPGRQI